MSLKINTKYIMTYKPCVRGLQNWVNNYNDFDITLNEFYKLDKIDFFDKVWLGVRCLTTKQQIQFIQRCSESYTNLKENDFDFTNTAYNAAWRAYADYVSRFLNQTNNTSKGFDKETILNILLKCHNEI